MLFETRPYFVLGDLSANAVSGAAVGALVALIVGPGWVMLVALVLGMIASLPMALLITGFFGAMEVMVSVMTTGMAMAAMYIANAIIRGRAGKWTP